MALWFLKLKKSVQVDFVRYRYNFFFNIFFTYLDIGCNIGPFTLGAAMLNHTVIAMDPILRSVLVNFSAKNVKIFLSLNGLFCLPTLFYPTSICAIGKNTNL